MVDRGDYPPMPDQVDFSLLNEPEEWEIFFNLLLPFAETVQSIVKEDSFGNFRTNKVCQVALALTNAFSRYYNRVRILREPLPHFLPTIFARLAFLNCVRITFEQIFSLLNIDPITKM